MRSTGHVVATFLLLFFILSSQGQEWGNRSGNSRSSQSPGVIKGRVTDSETGKAVEYATIAVISKKDSSIVSGGITDSHGSFHIDTRPGNFFLKIEFISFKSRIIDNIRVNREKPIVDIGTVKIAPSRTRLKEVEITAEKSQVQMSLDKKIFNVGKDIASIGGTATDVMENIPSVSIDINGDINLRGSSNVRILIDGKPSGMTGISTSDALQQIPANSIETIEVITNPSVRYEAEGMAGIINIKLKKEKQKGWNGIISLTGGWPHNHTGTISTNYRKQKVNAYGSYTVRYYERPGQVENLRETTVDDTTTFSDQVGEFTRGGIRHSFRGGFDYSLNEKNIIGASANFSMSDQDNPRTTEYIDRDWQQQLTNYYVRNQEETEIDQNTDYNLNYRRTFDKKDQLLRLSARYSTGGETEKADISEVYYDLDKNPNNVPPLLQHTLNKELQDNTTLKADYYHPIGEQGKFEVGYKGGFRNIDKNYDIGQFDDSTDTWNELAGLSNQFIYNEVIHAGYLLYGNMIQKFGYLVGMRAEQTTIDGNLVDTEEPFKKDYLNFFPSIHLSQELKNDNKMQVSYSRRIRRPSFWNLNPFTSYADPLNLWIGNPDVNPEFTDSYEVGHIKYWQKANLSSSVYYRHTTGKIERIKEIDSLGITTTRPQNLSTQESFGLELAYSMDLLSWWKINGSLNYFRNIVDGGNLNSEFTTDFYSWTARLNSTVSFWKKASIQFMVNYRAPRERVQGTRLAILYADIGFRKEILKGKGNITARISDISNARAYRSEYNLDNLKITSLYRRGVRAYYIGFSYIINQYRQEKRREGDFEMEGMEGG